MTDILFMFELDIKDKNMKFVILFLEIQFIKNKKLWILIVKSDFTHTHADNLSFNLTELFYIILVITCCSRTFLPHFLAKNLF